MGLAQALTPSEVWWKREMIGRNHRDNNLPRPSDDDDALQAGWDNRDREHRGAAAEAAGYSARCSGISRFFAGTNPVARVAWERGWDTAEAVLRHPPESGIWCSFCGKSSAEVFHMVKGPGDAAVCDECVELCSDMVAEKRTGKEQPQRVLGDGRTLADLLAENERLRAVVAAVRAAVG